MTVKIPDQSLPLGWSGFFEVGHFFAPTPWIAVVPRETSLRKIIFELGNIYPVLKDLTLVEVPISTT